jgi:hypothetical protein
VWLYTNNGEYAESADRQGGGNHILELRALRSSYAVEKLCRQDDFVVSQRAAEGIQVGCMAARYSAVMPSPVRCFAFLLACGV